MRTFCTDCLYRMSAKWTTSRSGLSLPLANADDYVGPLSCRLNALPPPARLTERHFPEKGQPCASGRPSQPVCEVCSNKKGRGKETSTAEPGKNGSRCYPSLCARGHLREND